ncbi:hypothetical protein [Nocardia sp. NPDC127526]|uniref:HalD/BesD family halogenase n=1 Tax=Nocardia sp. NPDC127526 TaxID=3345393 RepID=UPI0036252CE4
MQQHSTLENARKHLRRIDPEALLHARDRLTETGIARLGFLLPHQVKRSLAAEALTLVDRHQELGAKLPGNEPARHGIDIGQREVDAHGQCIPQLYDCESLRHRLSVVAAEDVLPRPGDRRYAITRLHHDDRPNEWHWGEYSFLLALVVECPPLEEGGFVQTVAHTRRDWDHSDIYRTLIRNPIRSWELHPGDLYLIRTDTTLHRVHPFTHGRRTIVSMSFASRADLRREQSRGSHAGGLRPGVRVMTNQAQ